MQIPADDPKRKGKWDEAYGSGAIVASGAWGSRILTDAHVVEGARNLRAKVGDTGKAVAAARGRRSNDDDDLALLEIATPDLPPVAFGSMQTVAPGRAIGVLGYPIPDAFEDEHLRAVVSLYTGRIASVRNGTIEIDVPIIPGESGGPVFDGATGRCDRRRRVAVRRRAGDRFRDAGRRDRAVSLRAPAAMIVLVTGPVRSGKSSFALELAREGGRTPVYVATYAAERTDPEMADRIARHRAARGEMRTIETNERTGPALVDALAAARPDEVLVVDSLGTWLAAHVLALEDLAATDPAAAAQELERRAGTLLPALAGLTADAVVVGEEAGWGVVPPAVLGRLFRDQLGRTAAAVAGVADRTFLVVAGYAVDLSAAGRRVSG